MMQLARIAGGIKVKKAPKIRASCSRLEIGSLQGRMVLKFEMYKGYTVAVEL